MITSNYQVDGDIYSYADKFFCDSSDDKPSNADAKDGLINGAILEETDTGKTYIFDKKANKWTEKSAGGGGTGGSTTLSGLTDVDISNPSDGQTLIYNSTSGKWENGAGGGNSDIFIVHKTFDFLEGTRTLDKTFAEIYAALAAGKYVQIVLEANPDESNYGYYDIEYLCQIGSDEGDLILNTYSGGSMVRYSVNSPDSYPVTGGSS